MRVGTPIIVKKSFGATTHPKPGDTGVVIGRHFKYCRIRLDCGDCGPDKRGYLMLKRDVEKRK